MGGSESDKKAGSGGSDRLPRPLAALMKDIDDCDRPACDDTVSALSAALGRVAKQNSAASLAGRGEEAPRKQCPPKSGVLGTSSWTLLHSMAAWYPDNPSADDERMMKQFMSSLARFYPCTYCADDFRMNMKKSPVRTKSREELCLWLCEQHNIINAKLGKPLFECSMAGLDERWRESKDPQCQKGP